MKLATAVIFLTLSGIGAAEDWKLGGKLEHTLWVSNNIPSTFLEFDDGTLYAPSLSLDFEYQPNPYFYAQSTFRVDRGFDAGTEPDGDYRFDTLFLRYRPLGDNRLNFQIGKFATVVGNWVSEYQDNVFLLAPLPYSSITGVNSQNLDQLSPQAIENRANGLAPSIYENKTSWSSIIWGPAYGNGASVFGNTDKWDYAFEIKNTSLGSTPEEWEFGEGDFRDPLFAGRIGYRPDAAWAFGASFSHGPYLDADVFDDLNPGLDRGDFDQTLIGLDMRWAHGRWLVSGEAFLTSYDRPGEDLEALSYYLQAQYKISPGLSAGLRFGQTLTNDVPVPSGGEAPWSPDLYRTELAIAWRITPELLFQAQYSYTKVTNDFTSPASGLFGTSISWKF